MEAAAGIPDPALIVLVGPSGSGKSSWAAERYLAREIVSSDQLRGVVGSGEHDLDASADAFALLGHIVTARARRGLTVVVDTLGLDPDRRLEYLAVARRHGLPAVAVVFGTSAARCRDRNRARDVPVPAAVLTAQLRRMRDISGQLGTEGWDLVRAGRGGGRRQRARPDRRGRAGRPAPRTGRSPAPGNSSSSCRSPASAGTTTRPGGCGTWPRRRPRPDSAGSR